MNEVLTQKRIEKIFPDYFDGDLNYPQVLKKKVFRCIGPAGVESVTRRRL